MFKLDEILQLYDNTMKIKTIKFLNWKVFFFRREGNFQCWNLRFVKIEKIVNF